MDFWTTWMVVILANELDAGPALAVSQPIWSMDCIRLPRAERGLLWTVRRLFERSEQLTFVMVPAAMSQVPLMK